MRRRVICSATARRRKSKTSIAPHHRLPGQHSNADAGTGLGAARGPRRRKAAPAALRDQQRLWHVARGRERLRHRQRAGLHGARKSEPREGAADAAGPELRSLFHLPKRSEALQAHRRLPPVPDRSGGGLGSRSRLPRISSRRALWPRTPEPCDARSEPFCFRAARNSSRERIALARVAAIEAAAEPAHALGARAVRELALVRE
jgi:hypothetical protein